MSAPASNNSGFDGVWDTVTDTPMGAQKATLTLASDGRKLTGTSAGAMGSLPIENGAIDAGRATWSMQFMGLTLTADVSVDGSQLSGGISAPGFGTSPIKGQRRS
jgi:hypothetical protein